jgi:outer membrane protein OmpA-like peptidoglycan-associated protein
MSDVQLKKKVQLKQKKEAQVVSLKRKGETAPIVTPLAGSVSETETAAAAATVAAAAQAATSASANTAAKSNVAGNGVPASGSSKVKSDAAQPSDNGKTPTATPSSNTSGNNQKKGGKAWPWLVICVAVIACLAFGAYKFLNSSGSSAENQELVADSSIPDNMGSSNANTSGTPVASDDCNSANNESSASGSSQVSNNNGTANANSSKDAGGNANAGVSSDANATGANAGSNAANTGANATGANAGSNAANTGANATGANAGSNAVANTGANVAGTDTGAKSVATNTSSSATQGRQISTNSADASTKALSSNNSGSVVDNLHNSRVATVSSVSETQAICLFAFDSANIEENPVLSALVAKAKQSNCKVIIDAYADEVGSSEYNQLLSQRRANAVKNYFTSRGVNSVIITANGNGESTQYASRAENRRADIKLQ